MTRTNIFSSLLMHGRGSRRKQQGGSETHYFQILFFFCSELCLSLSSPSILWSPSWCTSGTTSIFPLPYEYYCFRSNSIFIYVSIVIVGACEYVCGCVSALKVRASQLTPLSPHLYVETPFFLSFSPPSTLFRTLLMLPKRDRRRIYEGASFLCP